MRQNYGKHASGDRTFISCCESEFTQVHGALPGGGGRVGGDGAVLHCNGVSVVDPEVVLIVVVLLPLRLVPGDIDLTCADSERRGIACGNEKKRGVGGRDGRCYDTTGGSG